MTHQMIQDYKAGMKLDEIADKYYVSRCYVYYYLPKSLRRKKTYTLYHKEVVELYKQGVTTKTLAEMFNCTKTNIYIILKGNNVKMRRSGRPRKGEVR